ncbi:MAG: class I SAM-dependent methyltransferase [Bacteroidetes bacterium]|nr:class I SAM-dependent methyltransferase [Bacteroidota bacterium]
MNFLRKILKLSGTGFTHDQYYESMNLALKRLNNENAMLHYPLYVNETDSFIQAQKNLTDYCVSLLKPLKNKEILEIGCGNGVQALYINASYHPLRITGIDLNKANIEIANSERERADMENVRFLVDDAQNLTQIPSDSVDVLLNIESAFHYPDKSAFLKEAHRVLKPGGQFLIADLLSTRTKREGIMKIWGKPMVHHFWNRKRYDEEFLKSELVITYSEDISHQVRKGWSIYRNWLPKIKGKLFFQNVAFRIFYIINARLNIFFLSNRQQYFIYIGNKPA